MAIKNFSNKAAYNAAAKPTIESQVSMVETTKEVIVDGVNVITDSPVVGDVLFLDENNQRVYLRGGAWLQKANIPSAWTHVGYVFCRKGNKVWVIDKTTTDAKYADVLQYKITAITSTSITINLRIQDTSQTGAAQYATDVPVAVSLTTAEISATTAAEISAAVAAKALEKGDTAAWWAYLSDDGASIIVQCDEWKNYQQYVVSMTGGTIAFDTWGDMPAATAFFKTNGKVTNHMAWMNLAKFKTYYSTNGRTPTANIVVGGETGNDAPVKETEFNTNAYCAAIRAYYGTYENYLIGEYAVLYPQKYNSFALPDPEVLSDRYALLTAPTKAGGWKYKFPAFAFCANVAYPGLSAKWHLPGILSGMYLLNDDDLAFVAASVTKMGTTAITNSATRWFAERYNVIYARTFSGYYGYLNSTNVTYVFRVQAVALLNL